MPRTSFTQEKAFEGITVFREEKQKEGGKPLAGCNEANAQTSSAGGESREATTPFPYPFATAVTLPPEFGICYLHPHNGRS